MGVVKKYYYGKPKSAIRNLNEKLVAYWKFDSNLIDSIAGLTGSNFNITFDTGKLNQAAVFNPDTASVIEIPNNSVLNFSDGVNDIPFSMSFWIYSFNNSSNQVVICKRGGGTDEQYQIQKLSGGQLTLGLFTNTSSLIRRATSAADLNTWTHYAVTYDGSKTFTGINWYKNGVLNQDTGFLEGTYTGMPVTTRNLFLGRFSWTWLAFLNAKFDEYGIWKNFVLTPDEVKFIYNNGLGKPYPF